MFTYASFKSNGFRHNVAHLLITIVILVMLGVPFEVAAQTDIPTQDPAFLDMFDDVNGVMTEVFTVANSPYRFGVGANPEVEFTVPDGWELHIEGGAEIQFFTGVNLTIEGLLEQDDDDDEVTFTRVPAADAWGTICINGDGDFENANLGNGNGEANLTRVVIEGGGDGVDFDNDGLITLRENAPELNIGVPDGENSFLRDSQSNGIALLKNVENNHVEEFWWGSIVLHDVLFNSTGFDLIERAGVRMFAEENDYMDFPLLEMVDCFVWSCGGSGVEVLRYDDGNFDITDTRSNQNGWNENVNNGLGAGVHFFADAHFYWQGSEIDINGSEFSENTWDGGRFDHISHSVEIRTSVFDANEERGIFYDFEGESMLAYIEADTLRENFLDGLFVQKGAGDAEEAGMKIRGNVFLDNADDGGGAPIANIRLHGPVGLAAFGGLDLVSEISNNILRGANSGICLEESNVAQAGPEYVEIRNNIQFGAFNQGLRISLIGTEDNFPDDPIIVENNVFFGNGTDNGGDVEEAGIWIGEDNGSFIGEEEIVTNNLIVDNSDVGIQYLVDEAGVPEFDFNGFDDNGADTEGCDLGANCIVDDPLFVNTGTEDFHLFWNSPVINRGENVVAGADAPFRVDPEDEESQARDSSPNDMGAYGGPGAGDWGFEPYCAIASSDNVINDDLPDNNNPGDRDFLEWDYYRIFGHIYTPNGEIIDIGDDAQEQGAAYFEFTDYDRWYVQGTIHANGDPDDEALRNIFFRTLPGVDHWMRLEINIPDADCWLNGCDFERGGYNVYAYGGTEEDVPDLLISNCRMDGSLYQNLYVSGDIPVECEFSEFTEAILDGVYIYNNEGRSQVTSCLITGNGSDGTSRAGLKIRSCFPTVSESTIGPNYSRGIYLSNASPDIGGQQVPANVIYNNGEELQQSGGTGAEVYLTSSSDPIVLSTNIWDADGDGNRRGVFVYKSINDPDLLFDLCYWGGDDIWDNEITDFDDLDLEDKEDFFHNVEVPDDDAETADDFIAGGAPVPPAPDSQGDFEFALGLMKEGEFDQAIPYFWSHLADHTGNYDINSLQRLLSCVRRSSGDLDELRSDYFDYASDERTDVRGAFEARRLAAMSLLYAGRTASATDAFDDLKAEAPSVADSISIEMDVAWSELVDRGGEIDALLDYDSRIRDLEDRYEEALESSSGGKALLPVQFALEPVFPNPFNSCTHIGFALPEAGEVTMQIVDLQGRVVETLITGQTTAGRHTVTWNASNVSTGMYICRLSGSAGTVSTKLILTK